jgi:CheY-like chemotaxis protein
MHRELEHSNTVLVAEDSDFFRKGLAHGLIERGFRVIECTTGEECIAQARHEPPAIIIMDMLMPKLNGMAALQALRSHPATASISVIFLTATLKEQDVLGAMDLGVAGYFAKNSIRFDDLVEVIRKAIQPAPQPIPPPLPPMEVPLPVM